VLVLTILGLVGTAVLGIYAIYDQHRNRRVRRLVYDTFTVPLATAFRNDEGYKVSIQLERPGQDPQTFDAAYLTFVRFANFGREPIRKDDIAPANPLVLEAETDAPGEILDISLSSSSRRVTSVAVDETINLGQSAQTRVTFDFLDYHDGGIVRVLSSAQPKAVKLRGDIIGMRTGIVAANQPASRRRKVMRWAVGILMVAIEFAAIAASVFAYRWVTGSWANGWLLFLPPLAFMLPPVLFVALALLFDTRARDFPPELAYPKWIRAIRPGALNEPPPDWDWTIGTSADEPEGVGDKSSQQ
jgi:hypothetical protein